MSSNIISELKSLHLKYLKTLVPLCTENVTFEDLESSNPDVVLLGAIREIAEDTNDSEALPYISSLYSYFKDSMLKEDDFDAEIPDDNSVSDDSTDDSLDDSIDVPADDSTDDLENLSDNEETFANKYPTVDEPAVLLSTYMDWLAGVKGKPFYKTINTYYGMQKANTLNFLDRDFLWKFIKAISSCLTHLLIEGEQKEEALCLIDKYYDSLILCLNSVVHASDKEDVLSSFQYMVDFLGISKESSDEVSSDSEKQD